MNRKVLLLVTLFVEGGLYVVGLLLMGGPDALQSRFSISWSATGYALLLCIPLLVVLYFANHTKWPPLHLLKVEMEEKIVPIFVDCKVIDLAIIALLAGTGEELFFRGWMQSALADNFGIWVGVLIASLIFGLLHYLSITYFIYAFITGIYLGVIFHVSGNLCIVMGIHAIYDFIALVYLVRRRNDRETDISNEGDIEG